MIVRHLQRRVIVVTNVDSQFGTCSISSRADSLLTFVLSWSVAAPAQHVHPDSMNLLDITSHVGGLCFEFCGSSAIAAKRG